MESSQEFPRAILHLDADSFFASVESSKNPKLRGRPVVTGEERGIATSMSYEAKALGITRAMTIYQIRRDFPQVAIVSSDYEAYAMYSSRMFAIVRRYTHLVEEYSIDECFADITNYRKVNRMSYEEILRRIQDDIQQELNISVSLGCAPTKVLAKVGSKRNKPHGVCMISMSQISDVLNKVAVGDIWGVGWSTRANLTSKGISSAQALASLSYEQLKLFAHAPLIDIWNELNGRMVFQLSIGEPEKPKSISRTLSFNQAKSDRAELFAELARNIENACIKARVHGLVPKTVHWFLKSKEYKYQSYELILETPTHMPTIIIEKVRQQFAKIDLGGKMYRTTGVTLSQFCPEARVQLDLFGNSEQVIEKQKIFEVVDELGKRFGRHSVHIASSLHAQMDSFRPGRIQKNFFEKLRKTGKELCIPYLGETT